MVQLFRKRALVTGGAGLIGSHLVDLLLREGWQVRILDNLEPQTHGRGKPAWLPKEAEFIRADIRDRSAATQALRDIDVVFHQAAYGGYMPEISKYVSVNSFGTAQLLEIIRDENLPVRKVIVASSQVVYSEGAVTCGEHGTMYPPSRLLADLSRGDFPVRCPICGAVARPELTSEDAPLAGETVYAITKVDQERLVLTWGRQTGIPTVALRYACTYGPRQSPFNPYTGVIAIFTSRLLNRLPPIIYEDGEQRRDFCFVEDVARANLHAAESNAVDGLPVNVGTGRPATINVLSAALRDRLGGPEPLLSGEFRPGEMRQLTPDISRARLMGWEPEIELEDGIDRYLDWIRSQGNLRDYFSQAEQILRAKRIIHQVAPSRSAVR